MARIIEGYIDPRFVQKLMNGPNEQGLIHLDTIHGYPRNENYMKVRVTFEQLKEDTHNGTEDDGSKTKETAARSKGGRKRV